MSYEDLEGPAVTIDGASLAPSVSRAMRGTGRRNRDYTGQFVFAASALAAGGVLLWRAVGPAVMLGIFFVLALLWFASCSL